MAKAAGTPSKFTSLRKGAAKVGVIRLTVMLLLLAAALAFARFAWSIPLAVDAERALFDVRSFVLMPHVEQDKRIVLVTFTDDTLEATGRRSPLDRGLLARALTRLDALGPKAIGIDILIDQPQPEDGELQSAMQAMKTPTFLAFGGTSTNQESVLPWQEAFQRDFQASLKPGNVNPALILLEVDKDGVIRSWPKRPAGQPPILTDRMAGEGGAFATYDRSIAFRLAADDERGVFSSIPIDVFDSDMGAQFMKDAIAGKYVLVGGDITDVDRFDTPATRITGQMTTGLQLHATLLAQQLDKKLLPAFPGPVLWLLALFVVGVAAATGLSDIGGWKAGLLLIVQLAAVIAAPFGLHHLGYDTQMLPAFGWIVGWTLAYSAAASVARGVGAEQRKFAQGALGRYLPTDVAREILRDPDRLKLTGERKAIYALFSDLEGFTKLTHGIAPELVASLLNQYLDRLSGIVLAHGGTIDKFVGDALVAFWGAPLERESDGEMALRAAVAIAQAGDDFSAEAPRFIPTIGRTRVGLHYGDAIVGNFGGEDRIQYTALGDVMNTASRLEAANKQIHTRALVSLDALAEVHDVPLRPMGRITVRGRETPLVVFEPVGEEDEADAQELAKFVASFDAGDSGALQALETYAATRPEDAALANLLYRLKTVGPGGCFALD